MAPFDSLGEPEPQPEDEGDGFGLHLDETDLAAIQAELQCVADCAVTMAALHPGARVLAEQIRLALDSIADIAGIEEPHFGRQH